MAEQNRPSPDSLSSADSAPPAGGFSLRAIDSADRMTRSLSPWVREMLDGANAPSDRGSLVGRLLRRRTDESVSFLSTLAILRRFHRIVTRTTAWKASVGTVSPNLFEKFSEEMFKNWDMGANNISALLKINRQEEALEMPLAGEVGGPASAPVRQPANATPAMTMEEIRRRVAEARQFDSLSPSSVPNFVKSQDAAKPEVRPVGQHPSNRPAPPRPTDQPIARQLPGQTPPVSPTPPAAQPPAAQPPAAQPAAPSPRMMRRRMARQVEYLSMPDTAGDDSGESGGGDDSDVAPPPQFDTGPPGLEWLFSDTEASGPDWFTPTSAETLAQPPRRSTRSVGTPLSRPVQSRSIRTPAVRRPMRSAARPRVAPARPTEGNQSRPRPASKADVPAIAQRAVARLALSASGQLLASRPQILMGHVHRQATSQTEGQSRTVPQVLPSAPAVSALEALSVAASLAQTAPSPRQSERTSGPVPVSLADFALPVPQYVWQRSGVPSFDGPVEAVVQPEPLAPSRRERQPRETAVRSTPEQPGEPPAVRRSVARAVVQRTLAEPANPSAQPQPRRRTTLRRSLAGQPIGREPVLAVLQSRLLRPSPTVMQLRVPPAVARRTESIRPVELPAPETLDPGELRHGFEPVSGAWRSSLLRSQPAEFAPLPPEAEGTLGRSSTDLFDAVALLGSERPLLSPADAPSPDRRAAHAFLPALELDLARFRRATTTPAPSRQVVQPSGPIPGNGDIEPSVRALSAPRPQRANTAGAAFPASTLIERVSNRDFAGTRSELLGRGTLALAEHPPTPPSSAPSRGRGASVDPSPQRQPVHADPEPSQPDGPVAPSARTHTRLLVQRAAATVDWQPEQPATLQGRPRGLRLPGRVFAVAGRRSVAPARQAPALRNREESSLAVSPPTGTGLGESAAVARRLVVSHSPQEPISRLWRAAQLTDDERPLAALESAPGPIALADLTEASLFSQPEMAAPGGVVRRTAQAGIDAPLPLTPSGLRIVQQPQSFSGPTVTPADLAGSDEVLVDRMVADRSPQVRRRRTRASNDAPQSVEHAGATLLERLERRVYPPQREGGQAVRLPAAEGQQPRTEGTGRRLLQRSHQPGETAQAALQLTSRLRRSVAVTPASSAWAAEPLPTTNAAGLPNRVDSVLSLAAIEAPVQRATTALSSLASPAAAPPEELPLRRIPASARPDSAVQTISGDASSASEMAKPAHRPTRGAGLTATLLDLTRKPTDRAGLPRQRSGDDTRTRVPAVVRQASASAPPAAPAPVRPLSESVLRRDFAETRRTLLQHSSAPATDILSEREVSAAAALPAHKPAIAPGNLGRSASNLTVRQQTRHRIEPVSELWRSELLHEDEAPPLARGRDWAGSVAISGDDLLRPGGLVQPAREVAVASEAARPPVPALFAPLELALNRLLRIPDPARTDTPAIPPSAGEVADRPRLSAAAGRSRPGQSAAAAVQRLEAGGWRFKRSRTASAAPVERVQRALGGLATGNSRPIPNRPRTLLERVLQRDFAGVRVQMASLGPLGIEAAAQGSTVYLDRAQARLDSPDTLALLGHELTHVAAGGAAPLLAENRVQRSAAGDDLPLAHSLATSLTPSQTPSLTQRLSRQLVQMSLAEEEGVAEEVEAAVRRSAAREPTRSTPARGASAVRRPAHRAASVGSGSRDAAALAQRRLATSYFAPVSQSWPVQTFAPEPEPVDLLGDPGWHFPPREQVTTPSSAAVQRLPSVGGTGDGLPLAQPRLAGSAFASLAPSGPVTASATVDQLEEQGWRFKRREGASALPARSAPQAAGIQRAAADLRRDPSRGKPLPRRSRTLMERVLQRDFSGVRLQAARLEPLGVEAAAHGQTVYMQRSALAQLDRPDNLALLGHELTHVAAGTNPPVRRSEMVDRATTDNGSPAGMLPLSLPPASQLHRSLQHEESAANQVEQGIQALLSQNSAVQREPLSPRPANGSAGEPVRAQISGGGEAARRQRPNGQMPRLDQPFVQRSPLAGQPLSGLGQTSGDPAVQRTGQTGAVLGGVPTEAMPVVQRSPERQTESLGNAPMPVPEAPRQTRGAVSNSSAALATIQRTLDESEDFGYTDNAMDTDVEPDWDRLADKIYPLIKRMLQMERERRPL